MPKSYSDKLKDPRWQRKRLEVLQRANWTCECCERNLEEGNDAELHVHHRWYNYGKEPWEYPDECFSALCKPCHEKTTKAVAWFKDISKILSPRVIVCLHLFISWSFRVFESPQDFVRWLYTRYTIPLGIEKTLEMVDIELALFYSERKTRLMDHANQNDKT